MIVPVLVTSAVTGLPSLPNGACVTWLLTSSDSSPSPYRSSVAVFAPASTTWPSVAVIVPRLATCGATSAARPACLTVMLPLLMTAALGLPGLSSTT